MEGLFEGEVERTFEGEDGEGVVSGCVEDGFVVLDFYGGEGAGELVDPVDEVPVKDFD